MSFLIAELVARGSALIEMMARENLLWAADSYSYQIQA
jgi:hypothetical protein